MPRRWLTRAAALTSMAAAVIVALAGCGSSASFPGHADWLTAGQQAGRPPAFFLDNEAWSPSAGYSWSDFTVRGAFTGRAVAQHGHGLGHRVTAVAAIGTGAAFVAAEEAPNTCSSQLYWFRLDHRGHLGPLSAVGPAIYGEVNALAASADGQTVAYTLSGCLHANKGYLKVLNLRTGHTRRWTSVDLTDNGSLGLASNLSLSANGRLLAFVGWITGPNRASLRVLATRGPAGNLLGRSKAIRQLAAIPGGAEPRDAVAVSPGGTTIYLCAISPRPGSQLTTVASYRTGTGRLVKNMLVLPARDPAGGRPLPNCAMAVSRDGGHALVSVGVSYAGRPAGTAALAAATVDLATGRRPVFWFPVRLDPALAGPRSAAVSVAW
jgi:hypothetical protein